MIIIHIIIMSNTNKQVEVEILIQEELISNFTRDFEDLNNIKYEGSEIINEDGDEVEIVFIYRNFGDDLQFPEQEYYQLIRPEWIN